MNVLLTVLVTRELRTNKRAVQQHWESFRAYCDRVALFVDATERGDVVLAKFILYLVFVKGLSPATAKGYTAVVQRLHLLIGRRLRFDGDIVGVIQRKLSRWRPPGEHSRKPATPDMVRWVMRSDRFSVSVKAAVATGFALCLRSVEYVKTSAAMPARMRRKHVQFKVSRLGTPYMRAQIFGKTDDPHHGADRVTGVVPSDVIDCRSAVTAMLVRLAETQPHLGPEDPLFLHPDGRPVTAAQVSRAVKEAAVAMGLGPDGYSSHSLRIACASCLADAGYDEAFIQEFGRWKSDTFHIYVRRSIDALAAAAARMAATEPEPLRR